MTEQPTLEEIEHWIELLGEGNAALDSYEMREISVAMRLLCDENERLSDLLKARDAQMFVLVQENLSLKSRFCQCEACQKDVPHDSSCAVHGAPALPVGPCNCTVTPSR